MGVSAVPGSGKTWTLSLLAADIIARGEIYDDQEILIVTLVNSAVESFYHRVGRFVRELNLIPNLGYRVRTLHGLAHDIVRERPGLVGLDEDFRILDEKEARLIREEIILSRLRSNPGEFDGYLDLFLSDSRLEWVRDRRLPGLVDEIFLGFIRSAKNFQLSPQKLGERLNAVPNPLPLAEIGVELYAEYQRALQYRGGVDFDDLINYAYTAISSDPKYLDRLRYRWPFILEDEAQDSSYLQEMILAKLTGSDGNWVRVGDPNQAIFETFTTADPKYLREFIDREDVISRNLEESGRSTFSIIGLANHLAIWTSTSHPVESVRDALQAAPLIEPTTRDDPQSNPVDDPLNVHLVLDEYSPKDEVEEVVRSVGKWVYDNPDSTVAVLVPRNERGANLVTELKLSLIHI
jgi:DNA helicase-2/ATP-dependent DNA helicase PcrA